MNGHWVAAEGKQHLPGGGIHTARAGHAPAGRLHAVDPETRRVLCGEPLRSLVAFPDLRWAGMTSGVRCRECASAVHTQTAAAGTPRG